jgi:hypothetical protein
MQKSIMTVISSIIFIAVHEQLKKYVIMIISDGYH